VHEASDWFHPGTGASLTGPVTNQLWRNLLLAAVCERQATDCESASVCVLSLADDEGAERAVHGVRAVLHDPGERCAWKTFEELAEAFASAGEADWARAFRRRYLDLHVGGASADGGSA
jgi:hypothetical protein